MVSCSILSHQNQVVEEHTPSVKTNTEAIYFWLFECVLVEESQKFKNRELKVELHPLQMGGDKPVEEVPTFGTVPRREREGEEKVREEEGDERKGEEEGKKKRKGTLVEHFYSLEMKGAATPKTQCCKGKNGILPKYSLLLY